MKIRATGPGSSRNGLPAAAGYTYRGTLTGDPSPAELSAWAYLATGMTRGASHYRAAPAASAREKNRKATCGET